MNRFCTLLLVSFFYVGVLSAQRYFVQDPGYIKANSVWAFGNFGGLDFNTGVPTPFVTQMYSGEQCASVADSATGQLLFYAGGHAFIMVSAPNDSGRCWNRNHQVMPHGDGLKGCLISGTTAQGFSIVPFIDSPDKYYLFSLNYQGGTPALYYSVVDMTLDGGLGDIDINRKNILLHAGQLSEAMVVVPGNNCDVWLVVHAFKYPEFYAYRISKNGIDSPVVSRSGLEIPKLQVDYPNYSVCNMAVSPDRSMIALTNNYAETFMGGLSFPPHRLHSSGTHLFHFDPWTGTISDAIRIHAQNVSYGVTFSPDNSKLYAWTRDWGWSTSRGTIRQYDVTTYDSVAIAASAFDLTSGINNSLTPLRLYKDTIYVGIGGTGRMDRINQPNQQGSAANYESNAIILLSGQQFGFGINTPVVYPFHDTFYRTSMDTLICHHWDSIILSGPAGYDQYIWQDGVSGTSTRAFRESGTYWVKSMGPCHSWVDTFIVRGADVTFGFGPDTIHCNVDPIILNPEIKDAEYLWQDGSTAPSFRVDRSDTYWVHVKKEGCESEDTVMIHYADMRQDLGEDQILCQRGTVDLILEANVPQGADFFWHDGSRQTTYTVQDTGTYWIYITDSVCSATDTLHIERMFCDCFMELPTAFTPNGDGRNDTWRPFIEPGCPIHEYLLRVFDRWGNAVFTTLDGAASWNGTVGGNPAETGVYMFEVWFKGGTSQKVFRKGDITLIR